MKQLYLFLDGPIAINDAGLAYSQTMLKEVLQRYHVFTTSIHCVCRTIPATPKELSIEPLASSSFNVIKCPDLSNIKGLLRLNHEAKQVIASAVRNADYIVVRLPSHIGNRAVAEAKKQNKKYLIELVTCPFDALWNYNWKGKLLAPWMYWQTKWHVGNAPFVLYVTSQFLQQRYPTKGKTLGCSSVVLPLIDDDILAKRLDHIHQHQGKTIIGTAAGVHIRFKGQQYVIKALGKLKQQGNTDYIYQLAGSGDQSYLRSVAKQWNVSDQVEFLGHMFHHEVFDWLQTIDLYVQPSRQEGLPRALIEAHSMGVPSFGAKTAGIPELIEKRYLFSNTRRNIDEIIQILQSYDTAAQHEQSIANFHQAQDYQPSIINRKRAEFYQVCKQVMDESQ